ncbi:MAG: HAD-IA family hydrolase [Gammaproteobacteria bacterium]|nr:HAD-IA family hydrolase [Gammaproteobacteria bacterium]
MELKVITFDLDNTLWDVDRVIVNAERQMREWLGNHVPAYHKLFPPEAMFELRGELVARRPELRHDLSKLREALLFEAIRRCGYPEALAREYAHQAFALFFEARHEVEFFEGALESLAILSKHHILGALTNGNADFEKLKLERYFSFGFSAAGVGAGKPAPDMFHAALEHTGARPEEVVHVGDNLVDDVQGAAEVGMHTIWVNLTGAAAPSGSPAPTGTVSRVHDIPAAVVRISNG